MSEFDKVLATAIAQVLANPLVTISPDGTTYHQQSPVMDAVHAHYRKHSEELLELVAESIDLDEWAEKIAKDVYETIHSGMVSRSWSYGADIGRAMSNEVKARVVEKLADLEVQRLLDQGVMDPDIAERILALASGSLSELGEGS